MKYLLIHAVTEAKLDRTAQAEAEDSRVLTQWLDDVARRGVYITGQRLQPVRDATCVRRLDGEVLISDGPFAETKEQIAGFDIIDCADLDEALEIASKHPTTAIGTIEVRPFLGA
jgi:hypothetical protein